MTKPRIVTPDRIVCPENGFSCRPHNNVRDCRDSLHSIRIRQAVQRLSTHYQGLTSAGIVIAYWNLPFPKQNHPEKSMKSILPALLFGACLLAASAQAVVIRGTGTSAPVGHDLTD